MLEAKAGKVVGVAIERLAIQYLVAMFREGDATPGEMNVPDDERAGCLYVPIPEIRDG